MNNFVKNLNVWQKSVVLVKDVYAIADLLPKMEEYNLCQQLRRSITSVPLNIAEGRNRKSKKEYAHFINIAIGSLGEVEAILVLCEELNYFTVGSEFELKINEVQKMLGALYRAIKSKAAENPKC